MVADVAGEPVERLWQLIKSAALNRCLEVIPSVFPLFVGVFMLVLHVKKPERIRTEKPNMGKVDEVSNARMLPMILFALREAVKD